MTGTGAVTLPALTIAASGVAPSDEEELVAYMGRAYRERWLRDQAAVKPTTKPKRKRKKKRLDDDEDELFLLALLT